jgi:hypothetical protein
MPKKPLRETLRENQKGLDAWAAMYGKPQTVHIDVKPKREIKNHSPKDELEAAVNSDISECLANHPKVLFAVRQNTGAASYTRRDKHGNLIDVPVWFYNIIKTPEDIDMTIVDFWGLLTDFRLFAIDGKRRDWIKPQKAHEHEQAAFLQMVRDAGGVGIFATCAEDVLRAINVQVEGADF